MFLGIYLKNFKCYQGTQYVPGFSPGLNEFLGYLGDNGVGKSAILQALDAFFSKKPHWIRNKEAKKGQGDCFVAPIFCIEKKLIKEKHGLLEKVSNQLSKNLPELKYSDAEAYIVCISKREDGKITLFDGKKEYDGKTDEDIAGNLYREVIELYQYLHIDAEIDIDGAAKMDSEIYDMIIGSSIVDEVEKKFKEIDSKKVLIKNLNQTLASLIEEKFTKKLSETDVHYSYGTFKGSLSKLTTNVLARVSTEAFLDSRKLKYKGKQLDDLSSGQRRTALMDFILTILSSKSFNQNKRFILAIDEPEISLDASRKMNQFDKLLEISRKGIAVLFTSHWYGWIASASVGKSILIEEGKSIKRHIREYKNFEFPFKDMSKYEMRMIFDFLISFGASAEANEEKRYIACEGDSDLIYLTAGANSSNKIIPVSKGRVKKIADIFKDYYWKNNGPSIKNVLFIVDTDPEQHETFDNHYLKRWSKNSDLTVSLVADNSNKHNKCTIEDTLEPDIYLVALKDIYPNEGLIKKLEIKHEGYFGDNAFGLDVVEKKEFDKITKERKVDLAKKYSELLSKSPKIETHLQKLVEKCFAS